VLESICIVCHIVWVKWAVEMADEFEPEFDALREDVQTEILALSIVLEELAHSWGGLMSTRSRALAMRT